MKQRMRIGQNPSFNSVTGLKNVTFNPADMESGQMISEAQLAEVYQRIVADEKKVDECCRDIVFWEAHVQVVRMNTLYIDHINVLLGGGVVVSTFNENVSTGTLRRGLGYTVTFPLKWDKDLYVARNISAESDISCSAHSVNGMEYNYDRKITNYRIVEENSISVSNCQSATNNYSRFWYGIGKPISTDLNNNVEGHLINSQNKWGSFVHNVKDDGTVTITDNRRNTNYNIIRFYTQWILRETSDGNLIPDPE